MKVLVVSATGGNGRPQFGGAERFLVEMLPEFARHHDVTALVPPGKVASRMRDSGIDVRLGGPRARRDPDYVRMIRDAVRETSADVVSAHLLSAGTHARAALRPGHVPLVVTLHSSMRQYLAAATAAGKPRAAVNLGVDRLLSRWTPHLSVAVSRCEELELLRARPFGTVRRICNPLPREWQVDLCPDRRRARVRLGIPAGGPVVSYVGRYEVDKGFDRFVRLSACLRGEATFVAAGAGCLDPAGELMSLGHLDDVRLLYDASDVVVVPSRVEVFGRVAVEALASGCQVVHSGVGGLPEVTAGVGPMATHADDGHLEDAVRGALRAAPAPGLRHEAADRVRRRYSFSHAVARWLGVLDEASALGAAGHWG